MKFSSQFCTCRDNRSSKMDQDCCDILYLRECREHERYSAFSSMCFSWRSTLVLQPVLLLLRECAPCLFRRGSHAVRVCVFPVQERHTCDRKDTQSRVLALWISSARPHEQMLVNRPISHTCFCQRSCRNCIRACSINAHCIIRWGGGESRCEMRFDPRPPGPPPVVGH